MKSVDPSGPIDVHGFLSKYHNPKLKIQTHFVGFFWTPCQFLEILLRKSLSSSDFFGEVVIFLPKTATIFSFTFQYVPTPQYLKIGFFELLNVLFGNGWVRWSFFSPPEKTRPPRNTFKKVCDIRS